MCPPVGRVLAVAAAALLSVDVAVAQPPSISVDLSGGPPCTCPHGTPALRAGLFGAGPDGCDATGYPLDCVACDAGHTMSAPKGPGSQTCTPHTGGNGTVCTCPNGIPAVFNVSVAGDGRTDGCMTSGVDCSGCNVGWTKDQRDQYVPSVFTLQPANTNGAKECDDYAYWSAPCPDGTVERPRGGTSERPRWDCVPPPPTPTSTLVMYGCVVVVFSKIGWSHYQKGKRKKEANSANKTKSEAAHANPLQQLSDDE